LNPFLSDIYVEQKKFEDCFAMLEIFVWLQKQMYTFIKIF